LDSGVTGCATADATMSPVAPTSVATRSILIGLSST